MVPPYAEEPGKVFLKLAQVIWIERVVPCAQQINLEHVSNDAIPNPRSLFKISSIVSGCSGRAGLLDSTKPPDLMLEKQEVFTFAAYRPRFGFCLIHLSVTAIYETAVLALMLRLNPPFFRLPTVLGPLIWIAGWPVDKLLSRRADWILARHTAS